jgi:hypothetical protein
MRPLSLSTDAFSNLTIAFQYSHFSPQKARLQLNGGKLSGEVMMEWFHEDKNKEKAVRVSYRLVLRQIVRRR